MLSKLLPTPSDFPKEKTIALRKNLSMHLFDGSLYVFGMSFIAVPTIFPIFVKELGGSSLAIGSVHVLWTMGLNIPAAFVAQRLKRKSLFKSQMVVWGFVHRFMLLISAVAVLLLVGNISSNISVSLFLTLLFFTALFGSLSGLPWFQVFTKTVPIKLRGRLMGIRQLIGSIAGAFGGYIVGMIILFISFPMNFALLFFLGFLFTMISFYYLTQIEEEPTVVGENETPFSTNIIADAKRILTTNKNFRNYLISDAFIMMAMSAVSFYSIYAVEKFSLSPAYAGTFSAIVMITNIFANIVFGISADYFGHKINVIVVALFLVCAALIAIISTNVFVYGFVFMFIASAIQSHAISRQPFIAEVSSERERPLYVGIANTLTAPAMLLGIVFGSILGYVGYEFIFLVVASLALFGAFVLHRFVIDPRSIKLT